MGVEYLIVQDHSRENHVSHGEFPEARAAAHHAASPFAYTEEWP